GFGSPRPQANRSLRPGLARSLAAGLLVGQLAAVDLHLAREIEGEADLVALDVDDADNPQGLLGVADDDFFADSSRQCEHAESLPGPPGGGVAGPDASRASRLTIAREKRSATEKRR